MKKSRKNRKVVKIIAAVLVGIILIGGIYTYSLIGAYMFLPKVTKEQLDELDLANYKRLMIVAHPDDELLWGGGHLIDEDYLVVCITHGNDPVRSKEYKEVLKATGDKALMLSYPDKIRKKRSSWCFWKKDIESDIESIIAYKDWDEIVTHNQKGEYGHKHHIMTHKLVAEACDKLSVKSKQMYFGKYYKKVNLPQNLVEINQETLNKKEKLSGLYVSQKKTIKKLSHMIPYENWTERGNETADAY